MKTTLDLPAPLLERARKMAEAHQTSLEEWLNRSLMSEIESTTAPADDTEAFVAAFARGGNTETPVGKVHRHETNDFSDLLIKTEVEELLS